VGQERAVRQVSGLYQTFLAGTNPINRPIGTMLFLGPTDNGKTRVVETAAEIVIERSFVNCPEPHHFSALSSLYFQQLTNGRVIALSLLRDLSRERGQMLRIEKAANRQGFLTVSGHMCAENLIELKNQIDAEAGGRRIVLDLEELTLVDRDAVRFLEQCNSDGIRLRNCPQYILEWIARERDGR
jgi:hypothetical protein